MNVLDYAGWIAIFSRLHDVPWLPKTLANTHMATGMLSLLGGRCMFTCMRRCMHPHPDPHGKWHVRSLTGHRSFQRNAIVNTHVVWDGFRAAFVLTDAFVRSYYHFYVLGNV